MAKQADEDWKLVPQPEVFELVRGDFRATVMPSDDFDDVWDWQVTNDDDDDDDDDDYADNNDDRPPWVANGYCDGEDAKEQARQCALAILNVICPRT